MNRDERAVVFGLLVIAGIAVILMLCGCQEVRPPTPPPAPPTIAEQLQSMGSRFITLGALVMGLGMVVRIVLGLASVFSIFGGIAALVSKIPGIAGLATLAIAIGGAGIATGAAFYWLAEYMWAVVLACVIAGVASVWYCWPVIRRWFLRWKAYRENALTKR